MVSLMHIMVTAETIAPVPSGRPFPWSTSIRLSGLFLSLAALILFFATKAFANPEYREIEGHGGVPLNVVTAGDPDNPAILFIHGFSHSSLAFVRQFDSHLSEDFYLVSFDLRGHGLSGKPWSREAVGPSKVWASDVAAVMEATGVENPVLVGWSYGGFIVADYIRHYGDDDIAGINLVGSLGGLVIRSGEEETKAIDSVMELARKSRSFSPRENIEAAQLTAEEFYTPNMTEEERSEQFVQGLMMPSYFRRQMRSRKLDNRDVLEEITVPVLLTRGADDVAMSEIATDVLNEALSLSTLSLYPKTGHLPFYQEPERFNLELAKFRRKLSEEQ